MKTLKDLVKKNPGTSPTFGTDPSNPWATKHNVSEASERELLSRYLNSRGINPEFVGTDSKIAHAKSSEYSKWKMDHLSRFAREETIPEAKTIQGTALDKFRQAAAERARKHDDIERAMKARHAAGKEDMKGSIDRLEKQLNKEESINEVSSSEVQHHFNNWTNSEHAPYNSDAGDDNKVHQSALRYLRSTNVPKENHEKMAMHIANKFHGSGIHEESEHKVGDSVTVNSKFFGKQKGKVTKVDNQSIHVQRNDKKTSEKYPHDAVVKEDAFQDPQAATQMPFDGANTTNDTDNKRYEMTKSARIIKSIYKRKNVKEALTDWEKEDKSVQSYGKKPKLTSADKKSTIGENKPEARSVMTGGKTLTGQSRDMVEIDPSMKNRPDRPDTFDKGYPKKSPA